MNDWDIPDWWTLILLGLAAYRIYRLIAMDTLLDIPRAWLVGLPRNWREGMALPQGYRSRIAEFLVCPWCLGFWVSLGWWAAWQQWPREALIVAAPFALSTAVGLIAQLDPGE
jgi:hypothetical protein